MIGFAYAVAKDGATWLAEFLARRRSRKVAAAANVLYDSGVIVAELRGLRDRMRELFVPLSMFNPEDWPKKRRSEWIEHLRTFASSGPEFGVMDEHATALSELEVPDDAAALSARLVELAANVTHLGEAEPAQAEPTERWLTDIGEYHALGRKEEGDALFRSGPGSPDVLIQNYLPALLWLVRHADEKHPEQLEALRKLAHGLLVTRTRRADRSLDDVVRDAETTFGALTGRLTRTYPEIPPPTWVAAR